MRALRKGQASAFNLTRDIRGEARIVERAFGLGVSALAEAAQLVGGRLEPKAACRGLMTQPDVLLHPFVQFATEPRGER